MVFATNSHMEGESLSNRKPSRYSRCSKIMDVGITKNKVLAAIGVGRLGSIVVEHLVRHGVAASEEGGLILIDDDVVGEGNLLYSFQDKHIGMPKVEALASIIEEIVGHDEVINMKLLQKKITKYDAPYLVELSKQCDMVVDAIDDVEASHVLHEMCHPHTTLLKAQFGRHADTAIAAWSTPQTKKITELLPRAEEVGRIDGAQALGVDVHFVASFVSALAIRLLLGDAKGKNLLPLYANAPMYGIGLRPSWIFSDMPKDQARAIYLIEVT